MSLNISIIRESFEQAKPIGPKVVSKFYDFLFTDYPAAKPLFQKVNLERQKKALLSSLVFIVDHLDEERSLHDYLFKMGQRHVDYGAEEEHYDLVGASLLKTFSYFFKENWTAELNEQWTVAFGAIKSMMMEGQKSVINQRPADLRAKATEICNALLLEVLETELNDEVIESVRAKVREIMYACLEEESAKLLKKVG